MDGEQTRRADAVVIGTGAGGGPVAAVLAERGLYVVDAASLPSNIGVNPQITIMANALRMAEGVAAEARAST